MPLLVAAGALFRDAGGRIMLVKPHYKPQWDIPGGIVDNERVSNLLIDEFRAGKIGKLTIDRLPEAKKPEPIPDKPLKTAEKVEKIATDTAAKEEDHADL